MFLFKCAPKVRMEAEFKELNELYDELHIAVLKDDFEQQLRISMRMRDIYVADGSEWIRGRGKEKVLARVEILEEEIRNLEKIIRLQAENRRLRTESRRWRC